MIRVTNGVFANDRRRFGKLKALCLASVMSLPIAAAAQSGLATPLPIEAIARFEAVSNVSASPDGKHIVGLVGAPGQKWPVISIWDSADLSKAPVWIPSDTNRIVKVGFFGDDKLLFVIEQPIIQMDGRPAFTRKLYMADIDGKHIVEPFKMTGTKDKEVRDYLASTMSVALFKDGLYDENVVLISRPDPATLYEEIYAVNKKSGETKLVAKESEKWHFVAAGVDLATGEPLIRQAVDVDAGGKYVLKTQVKDRATGAWIDHPLLGYELNKRVEIEVMGFDRDPDKLFVKTNRVRDHSAIYSYDLKAKTFSEEPLYANDQYDIVAIGLKQDFEKKQFDHVSSLTIGGPADVQVIFDEKWAPVQKAIRATFPGKNVYIQPAGDGDLAVVRVEAVDFPPSYYLYQDKALKLIGQERPWIDPATLGKGEFTTYKARDGLEIPAIITHPPGWTPQSPPGPLVVLPHGGPWARDDLSWDASGWPQFLATRGVTVIQPQYRGSEGWGDNLWKAGDGQWGLKMSDDNDDAAAYMVARGIADPRRMAIFGYSYGGFAAIAASVRPNSPYKCAIAGAGVSSLQRIGNLWGANHIQRDIQGHTVDGMDPLKNVDKANIPIMLYHGDHDRQADTDHSRMFYAAMKAAGKDVEYHEIQGMWHTLPWHPEWHTQTLTLIENYLASDKCGVVDRSILKP